MRTEPWLMDMGLPHPGEMRGYGCAIDAGRGGRRQGQCTHEHAGL